MRIALGSDHGGVKLKKTIKEYLSSRSIEVKDFGTDSLQSCDYPDYALKAAESVSSKESDLGILICKTGIGMSIAANKVPGIRAALCKDKDSARLSREHNDANVLALAGETLGADALEIVRTWINSGFSEDESRERHKKRVNKIHGIEKKYFCPPSLG